MQVFRLDLSYFGHFLDAYLDDEWTGVCYLPGVWTTSFFPGSKDSMVLRKGWVNFDLIWAYALVFVGGVALVIAN